MYSCTNCGSIILPGTWMLVDNTYGSYLCPSCTVSLFPRMSGRRAEWKGKAHTDRIPDVSRKVRTVGFEFEGNWMPSTLHRLMFDFVTVKDDGSLRGVNAAEVITDVLTSTSYVDFLQRIQLKDLETYSRAGCHVWIGIPDYSWIDTNKLLYFGIYHQRELVSILPATRRPSAEYNQAGTPMEILNWPPRIYQTKEGFLQSLYGLSGAELRLEGEAESKMHFSKRANDRDMKYPGPINRSWWMNIHAYFYRKCVEIRLLHTTPVWEVVYAWTEMWLRIIENVPNMSAEQLKTTTAKELAPKFSQNVLWGSKTRASPVEHFHYIERKEDFVRMFIETDPNIKKVV